jgi:hypothetical protein
MKITADITPMKILNINMLEGNEMILLSIPMKDNVVDMNEEVLFTHYIDNEIANSGTKKTIEIFNLFKHVKLC